MKTALIAFIVSVVTAVLLGKTVIPLLKKLKLGQNILSYVKEHDYKSGTPTMGGVIFVFAAVLSFIIFAAGREFHSGSPVIMLIGNILTSSLYSFM